MVNKNFKYNTTIRTPRLLLRPIDDKHAEHIWTIRSYREIYKWTMAGQWREKSDANEWIKTNLESENSYNFIIELLPQSDTASSSSSSSTSETISNPLPPKPPTTEPVTIGSIGIHRDQEVGYMFHPDYWGKGYATEALDAFVKKVWEVLAEVKKLTGFTDSENAGSQGVLRKCGFKEVRREPYVNATMGERTEVIFEIVRPEYKSGDVCSW